MVGLPGSKTLKIRVAEIWAGPIRRKSALVSVHTTVFYRSASAKVYLFLQLSSESWSFDSDGSLFVEKAVLLFLPELFARWAAGATNHIVSIVLFSRVYYAQHEVECLRDRNVGKDPDDRPYRDFFQVRLSTWSPTDGAEHPRPRGQSRLGRCARDDQDARCVGHAVVPADPRRLRVPRASPALKPTSSRRQPRRHDLSCARRQHPRGSQSRPQCHLQGQHRASIELDCMSDAAGP